MSAEFDAPRRVVALSGGVGGAKLACGLAQALVDDDLLIIANTGDDFEHLGLHIAPDLDSVMYALADINNRKTGWGVEGESWHCLAALERLGAESWFRLGDRDLATHLARTAKLRANISLSVATRDLCRALDIRCRLEPMSDDPVRTIVLSEFGELEFQDYFVRRKCVPAVSGFRFAGVSAARPNSTLLNWLSEPGLRAIIICPSNPYVSIDPILALPGLATALRASAAPVVAISPIVGREALKGPAAKMMRELGVQPSAAAIAAHYGNLLNGLIADEIDGEFENPSEAFGCVSVRAQTVMRGAEDALGLARCALSFADNLRARAHTIAHGTD